MDDDPLMLQSLKSYLTANQCATERKSVKLAKRAFIARNDDDSYKLPPIDCENEWTD